MKIEKRLQYLFEVINDIVVDALDKLEEYKKTIVVILNTIGT